MNAPLEQKLNSIKHRLFPLRRHVIAAEQPAVVTAYATLLAAVLRNQSSISAEQEMLFRRLLHAMGLEGQQAQLLAKGGQLSAEELLESISLIKQTEKTSALLLDILILLRVSNPISQQEVSLLSELTLSLDMPPKKIEVVQFWVGGILGLDTQDNTYKPRISKHVKPGESKSNIVGSWSSFHTLFAVKRISKKNMDYICRGEKIIDSELDGRTEYANQSGVVLTQRPAYIYIVQFPHQLTTWLDHIDFQKIINGK